MGQMLLKMWGNIDPVVPHAIDDKGIYRYWSDVSRSNAGSYLKRTSPTQVSCTGTDEPGDKDSTLVTAHDLSTPIHTLFRFVLKNPTNSSNWYVITGGKEGTEVYLQDVPINTPPPKDKESLFEPYYFYSYTSFRCCDVDGEKDLYIGSNVTGKTTMVKRGTDGYPNPAVLFVAFKSA